MSSLEEFCKELKTQFQPKKKNRSDRVVCWSEKDVFNEHVIDAFVIILRTRGCDWAHQSGCSMCGYFNDSAFDYLSDEQMLDQFRLAMKKYHDEPVVKIFTSGSFFDEHEISISVRTRIFSELSEKTEKIAVESRPEFIRTELLDELDSPLHGTNLEVGIGLETADDRIRTDMINKGFSFREYHDAARLLSAYNFLVKTYVLLKPPFLSEQQAIEDAVRTIKAVGECTDSISLNPANVQKNTFVEYLWKRQYYRPPWLWSVVEVLKHGSLQVDKRLQCDVAGGGSIRGAHNCRGCDKRVLKQIRSFSLSQNHDDLNNLDCSCRNQWEDQLVLEPLGFGSLKDIQRGLIS